MGALTAAVVGVVAPFLRFWKETYSETQPGPRNASLVITGFGHNTYHPASSGQAHGHDTNYGVPLVIAAIVLAAAAIVLLARKGNVVLAMLLAVIGGSMLGAIAVEAAEDLAARASFDSKYGHWTVGYGWWLMVLAGGLGAIMAVAATASVVRSGLVHSPIETGHSLSP